MAKNDGTETPEGQAPEDTETVEPTGAVAEVTITQPDEVTKLRSRNQGLDAKVTSLTRSQKEAIERAEAAEAKLNEIVTGKANGDEETRALILKLNAELDASKATAKAAILASRYPESYAELGDSIATMPEDKLAGIEARLAGVPAESNRPPTPISNSAARPITGAAGVSEEGETGDAIEARLRTLQVSW